MIAYFKDGTVKRMSEDQLMELQNHIDNCPVEEEDEIGLVCVLPEEQFIEMMKNVSKFLYGKS